MISFIELRMGLPRQPWWDSVLLQVWLPFVLVAGLTALVWYFDRRHITPGRCQKCGYDLTKNESGRCPECGVEIEAKQVSA